MLPEYLLLIECIQAEQLPTKKTILLTISRFLITCAVVTCSSLRSMHLIKVSHVFNELSLKSLLFECCRQGS